MNRLLVLVVTMVGLNSMAQATTGFGVCNHGKETIPSVVCYGPTVLKQTTVTGDIKVTGSLEAANILAQNVVVDGATSISNSEVNGTVNITGDFQADHVEFSKGVAVTADSLILSNTKVNGLLTVTSVKSNPVVQLLCGSTITGSVLFDNKAGVVQVTGDSMVQGKVVNGSLVFVKKDCGS